MLQESPRLSSRPARKGQKHRHIIDDKAFTSPKPVNASSGASGRKAHSQCPYITRFSSPASGAIRTKEQISILPLELRVQLQNRDTLSFNLSRYSSWCSGFREPRNISALCSHSAVRGRRHRNGRADPYVYSGRPNRGQEDQDFEEEERRRFAGGIFKQRGIVQRDRTRPTRITAALDLLRLTRGDFDRKACECRAFVACGTC